MECHVAYRVRVTNIQFHPNVTINIKDPIIIHILVFAINSTTDQYIFGKLTTSMIPSPFYYFSRCPYQFPFVSSVLLILILNIYFKRPQITETLSLLDNRVKQPFSSKNIHIPVIIYTVMTTSTLLSLISTLVKFSPFIVLQVQFCHIIIQFSS